MHKTPKKQKQDKYERLINTIRNYQHTKEEKKMLYKVKLDTVFQIALRHTKCEANKKYIFPFTNQRIVGQDDQIHQLTARSDGKDLVYDLNSQNYCLKNNKINSLIKVSPREKMLTQPSDKQKARSLSRKIKRVLIGRLHDDMILAKDRFFETYRIPTQSTISSQKHTARKPSSTSKNKSGAQTCRISSQKIKTQQSPLKKSPLLKQFQTLTLKKIANRLRTQKSSQKKGKIQTLISNQLKKQTKQGTLMKSPNSLTKMKTKSILNKNYY